MNIDIILDVCLPIVVGIVTAGFCWFIANILFVPYLEVSDLKFTKKNRPYILISNKSKSVNAYEIVCYVSYYENGKLVHTRVDNTKPALETSIKRRNSYQVKLDGSKRTHELFRKDGCLELHLVVSYQNKFGVKKSVSKSLMAEDDGDNN